MLVVRVKTTVNNKPAIRPNPSGFVSIDDFVPRHRSTQRGDVAGHARNDRDSIDIFINTNDGRAVTSATSFIFPIRLVSTGFFIRGARGKETETSSPPGFAPFCSQTE